MPAVMCDDELVMLQRHAWHRVSEVHGHLARYHRLTEEARDRAIDLSLLDDNRFEPVVDVLTAVGVNVSIAVSALAEVRMPRDLLAAGMRRELRPAPVGRTVGPAAGDEEHHAWRRLNAYLRASVLCIRHVERTMVIVGRLSDDDDQLLTILPFLTAVLVNARHARDTLGRLRPSDEPGEPRQ